MNADMPVVRPGGAPILGPRRRSETGRGKDEKGRDGRHASAPRAPRETAITTFWQSRGDVAALSSFLSPAGLWRLAAALRLRGVVVRGRMIASVQPPRRNGERARSLLCHLLQGPGCMVYLPCLRGRAPGGQAGRPGLASLVLVPVPAISGARVCPVNGQRPPCTIP